MMVADMDPVAVPAQVTVGALTDVGTERESNEDACGIHVEEAAGVLVVVADGVSGYEGGEIASRTAVDVTLSAFVESPASWGPAKRIFRAVQRANIEIYDRAQVVPELRRMSCTITAVLVHEGIAYGAHVGDSRLYLIREGSIVQKTKDHTVTADRVRLGLLSAERARSHPDRSTLTHSLGPELIAAIDRLSFPLAKDDVLLVCSDGLYNVLVDDEMRTCVGELEAKEACAELVQRANERGTPDNLTAAVLRVVTGAPEAPPGTNWRSVLGQIFSR
jgi:protein phosphatase